MANRRNKSQARRTGGNTASMPGWAWLVMGILLAALAFLLLPKLVKSDGDGFFRPSRDAAPRPIAEGSALEETPAGEDAEAPSTRQPKADAAKPDDYDFYTVLPGEEVAMSDAQLAAATREEAARRARDAKQAATQNLATSTDATATTARPAALPETTSASTQPTTASIPANTTTATTTPASTAATTANAAQPASTANNDTPYILQAGAFAASGDAEAIKARIALLGLNARVESASINGKTVYRVRMGPYGSASELSAAKSKLAGGGLPAMAIKAK